MKKQHERKIILINRKFQFKMILKFILVNAIILTLFAFLCYVFFDSEIESNLHSAHVSFKNMRDMLFPLILTLSLINIIISSLLISGYVLYASFRLAGPMYRFNEISKAIGERDLNPITKIRSGDQFSECSRTISVSVKTLSDDIALMKEYLADLKDLTDKNAEKEALSGKIKELEEITGKYRLQE
jgi:hypothetical protein